MPSPEEDSGGMHGLMWETESQAGYLHSQPPHIQKTQWSECPLGSSGVNYNPFKMFLFDAASSRKPSLMSPSGPFTSLHPHDSEHLRLANIPWAGFTWVSVYPILLPDWWPAPSRRGIQCSGAPALEAERAGAC